MKVINLYIEGQVWGGIGQGCLSWLGSHPQVAMFSCLRWEGGSCLPQLVSYRNWRMSTHPSCAGTVGWYLPGCTLSCTDSLAAGIVCKFSREKKSTISSKQHSKSTWESSFKQAKISKKLKKLKLKKDRKKWWFSKTVRLHHNVKINRHGEKLWLSETVRLHQTSKLRGTGKSCDCQKQ